MSWRVEGFKPPLLLNRGDTMKYESSILKRLIDTYGVVGNPCYISEIIKEFIVRGKERFPELFTYQSDWLAHIDEFGLNPTYTVSYTGQSIYAPNTLERPVKRAILKGCTLTNLLDMTQCSTINYLNTQTIKIKQNTVYTIKTTLKESNILISNNPYGFAIRETDENGNNLLIKQTTSGNLVINTTFTNTVSDTIQIRNYNQDKTKIQVIIIEGDYTDIELPYFTGMKSVKMPVLTTVGKNLFDLELVQGGHSYGAVGIKPDFNMINSRVTNVTGNYIKVNPNTKITFSISNDIDFAIAELDINGYTLGDTGWVGHTTIKPNHTITTKEKTSYIGFNFRKFDNSNITAQEVLGSNPMLEISDTATTYEPFKSNILTVNEPVELRGIGEVQDTLDCLTGEVTERIGEIVLDGSHNIVIGSDNIESYETMEFFIEDVYKNGMINHKQISDKLPYDFSNDDYEHFYVTDERVIVFVKKSKLATQDTNGFKQYLSQNPLIVQYQLATESIKTVELTTLDQNGQNVKQLMSFNGGTHFTTTSQDGSLLPTLTVTVETDLEETLRVCSLDGNTM